MEKVPCPQAIASVIARRNVEVLGNRYLLIGSYYKLVQNLDFKYVRSFLRILIIIDMITQSGQNICELTHQRINCQGHASIRH